MASIRVSFDSDSNGNEQSERQLEKEFADRISTEAGTLIFLNEEQSESAEIGIRVSSDPDSNTNDESDVHKEKEHSPRDSTDAGRQIDSNPRQPENAAASI
jgi:hypothetical protein